MCKVINYYAGCPFRHRWHPFLLWWRYRCFRIDRGGRMERAFSKENTVYHVCNVYIDRRILMYVGFSELPMKCIIYTSYEV